MVSDSVLHVENRHCLERFELLVGGSVSRAARAAWNERHPSPQAMTGLPNKANWLATTIGAIQLLEYRPGQNLAGWAHRQAWLALQSWSCACVRLLEHATGTFNGRPVPRGCCLLGALELPWRLATCWKRRPGGRVSYSRCLRQYPGHWNACWALWLPGASQIRPRLPKI